MNLQNIKKAYLIGIKGVGMTMLAQFLAKKGIEIVGSDTSEKFMTDGVLTNSGIKFFENFDEKNIPEDADLVIHSTAYNENNNVEIKAAISKNKKIISFAEATGSLFNNYYGIAVVGSHGKTTTAAWLGFVMDKAGKNPNAMVGAKVPQFNGNVLMGRSDYLVAEVDEYQNKLKHFNPQGVLLNNIDYDHPDFFPTKNDYQNVFIEFIKKIPNRGFLVANFDDPIIRKIANVNCRGKVISYAIQESAEYVAYDIKHERGKQYFKVKLGLDNFNPEDDELLESSELGEFCISLSGKHNILNALAVIATCIELEINLTDIRKYLEEFTGTVRRMQVLGEYRKAIIVDDYAHHPTEIRSTLAGAKETYKDKKIITVFHPHTFTRTKALFKDFSESFNDTDELIVVDIYGSAREKQGGVSSQELVNSINKNNPQINAQYIPTLEKTEQYLRENIGPGEVVILMGAGDIFRVGENLIK